MGLQTDRILQFAVGAHFLASLRACPLRRMAHEQPTDSDSAEIRLYIPAFNVTDVSSVAVLGNLANAASRNPIKRLSDFSATQRKEALATHEVGTHLVFMLR